MLKISPTFLFYKTDVSKTRNTRNPIMDDGEKTKLTLTILVTFLAISISALTFYRRRRRRRHVCYLETESTKPQASFKRVLADNSYNLFKHLNQTEDKASNSHPYHKEILDLLGSSQIEEFGFVIGEVDLEMKGSHVWVDRKEQLEELVGVLSKERVFAVDTEQHSFRSFLGFTALMQISTENEDYLVDTIALHDVMDILHPVFANPKICKVFHGADNDVIWLQRDFHIYVVNLFDTAKACEVLLKPQKSLAYLLENYCRVTTDKTLQRGDWRLRPLSEEMVQYARADAHYLLYIADHMASELKYKNIEYLYEASRLSNTICLKTYTKEIEAFPGQSAASSILSRYFNGQGGVTPNSEIEDLVKRLCMWRDLMARVHDESVRYVLSDQAIVALALKAPTTAAETYEIISKAGLSLESHETISEAGLSLETYETISEAGVNLDFLTVDSFPPSPSLVVCSHLEDICDLLEKKISNVGDVFRTIIRKHLGPSGSCPLSTYNYALLKNSNVNVTNGFSAKQNGIKASKRFGRKASRQLFVQKFSCKSPVYHNCRIYASDGRLLCYCDRRKLEWYLRRGLAKLVENDPPAIMILFEPKGRPEDEDNDFYIQSKKNVCVGCGESDHYLRYRIIPSCYRVHFPEHLKSHRSHDIVLLCVDCHEIAHSAAEKHKRRTAAEFGIPLFVKKVVNSRQTEVTAGTSESGENAEEAGVSPLQLRGAAQALLRHGPNMPTKRQEELTQTVMKFFGGRRISKEDLERALLVGMSPRERRRIEKKRGYSLRHSSGAAYAEALEYDLTNGSQTAREGNHCKQEDENLCMEMDTSAIFEKDNVLDTDEDLENRTVSSTYNQKLSLLGHGPHGKQVVDHLLKEYGEDGIRVFCQRWRQVFVESINPRFLPSGWDVMHRGRRDFGDYSVYNPLKTDTTTATD